MPYPGWSDAEIAQYKAILADVAQRNPKMSHDEAQSHAARMVNARKSVERAAPKVFQRGRG